MAMLVLFSTMIGKIHSLNLPNNDKDLIKYAEVSDNNSTQKHPLLGDSSFGVYIGGSVGGLVGLLIILALLYFFCFRRRAV